MSEFFVRVLPRAELDVATISGWIYKRSPQGAASWVAAFALLIERLERDPRIFGASPESVQLERPLKQAIFKTPSGRNYRAVFVIESNKVFVLRVRGLGEPELKADEL